MTMLEFYALIIAFILSGLLYDKSLILYKIYRNKLCIRRQVNTLTTISKYINDRSHVEKIHFREEIYDVLYISLDIHIQPEGKNTHISKEIFDIIEDMNIDEIYSTIRHIDFFEKERKRNHNTSLLWPRLRKDALKLLRCVLVLAAVRRRIAPTVYTIDGHYFSNCKAKAATAYVAAIEHIAGFLSYRNIGDDTRKLRHM